jgi:hypothetical protein
MFIVKNEDFLKRTHIFIVLIQDLNDDLHIPIANLTAFRKVVWYSGIKIYNRLPPTLQQLSYDISKFKMTLKNFFLQTLFTH